MMKTEIKLAKLEFEELTGFKGSRSDFSYMFLKYLEKKRDKFFNFFKFKKEEKRQTLKIFKNENKILKG